ncbi:PREDICTED: uncharacterized protein LOC104708068 [Camelina sativa]|uniref:Uncharacterized protein LOC104708068 n=1 Tax=Camelina sativa TaxID=90675 RepID=A0ABM1QC82_CAMSA|nr:PREDICTED: uncharacterized protein LOC104708068 [Camelina sativa]
MAALSSHLFLALPSMRLRTPPPAAPNRNRVRVLAKSCSENKTQISVLEEISKSLDEAKPVKTSSAEPQKSNVKRSGMDNVDPHTSQKHQDVVAMVGLDAMKRANSTLEDFFRSYFLFHRLDINEPQSIFRYLPVLSFTESYIYQVIIYSEYGWNAESRALFEADPLKPLEDLLEREGLLTQRIQQEFKSGEEYWALERELCHALSNKDKICLEDVMRAIHLKSFDYRVLSLLLYKLRGEEVNELHMDFSSVSEFLVEIADDLFDYEDDVLENNFNVLCMFVGMFGASNAPTELAKQISEAEVKYEEIKKSLDPHLSSKYQRSCEESTKAGGKISGNSVGTWNIPAVISDEEAYRAAAQR